MKFMKTLRHSFLAFAAFASLAAFAPAATPAADRQQRRFEIQFLTSLIDRHASAVQLAELAADRATHEELQTFAAQLQTNQAAEVEQVQAWLQTWYGLAYEPEADRHTLRQVQQLTALTGEEFEAEFIDWLTEHHLEALHHATRALREAQHPESINFAALSIGAQADEIAQLRLWSQQWFDASAADEQAAASDNPSENGRGILNRRDPATLNRGPAVAPTN